MMIKTFADMAKKRASAFENYPEYVEGKISEQRAFDHARIDGCDG